MNKSLKDFEKIFSTPTPCMPKGICEDGVQP